MGFHNWLVVEVVVVQEFRNRNVAVVAVVKGVDMEVVVEVIVLVCNRLVVVEIGEVCSRQVAAV